MVMLFSAAKGEAEGSYDGSKNTFIIFYHLGLFSAIFIIGAFCCESKNLDYLSWAQSRRVAFNVVALP